MPKAVISTIPKLLVDKGIGESKLDCNKHDPILSKQKAKGQRKPRQSKKRKHPFVVFLISLRCSKGWYLCGSQEAD